MSLELSLIKQSTLIVFPVILESDIPTTVSNELAVNIVAGDVPTALLVYLRKFCAILLLLL
tara:strand:- start:316 stop:498 length:183 start_codon:yes stop_codon:yes gene_type:complete